MDKKCIGQSEEQVNEVQVHKNEQALNDRLSTYMIKCSIRMGAHSVSINTEAKPTVNIKSRKHTTIALLMRN